MPGTVGSDKEDDMGPIIVMALTVVTLCWAVAYDGMENGERTCARRPGRFVASPADTALTEWSHGTGR